MIAAVRIFFGRTYWSLRMHLWLRRENRALANLQSRSVALIADRLRSRQSTPNGLFLGDTAFITDKAEQFQLQPFIFGDRQSFIQAVSDALPLDDRCEIPTKSPAEQEADLIAEYDAHFLRSIRIKPSVQQS